MNQESPGAELSRNLGRLEGKLDVLLLQLTEHVKKDELAWERVADLEKKLIYAAGIASTIMFALTTGAYSIIKKVFS